MPVVSNITRSHSKFQMPRHQPSSNDRDAITAVNSPLAKTVILPLQTSSAPRGIRLSLRPPTDISRKALKYFHDNAIRDVGRREAQGLLLGLVEYACNDASSAPENRSIYFVRAPAEILSNERFQADLEQTVDDKSMDRKRICLEISETAFDEDSCFPGLFRLADRGFLMSLASFGTGFAPFELLRYLPVAFLQIAPSFASEVATDPFSKELVRCSNELGHLRGLHTIAAGVDSYDCINTLRELGVDYLEGPALDGQTGVTFWS